MSKTNQVYFFILGAICLASYVLFALPQKSDKDNSSIIFTSTKPSSNTENPTIEKALKSDLNPSNDLNHSDKSSIGNPNQEQPVELTQGETRITIEVEDKTNDGSQDFAALDPNLTANGEMFSANFEKMLDSNPGDEFSLTLKGITYRGTLKSKDITPSGRPHIKMTFDDEGEASIFFGIDKNTGNIRTKEGELYFEQKGSVGFLIEANALLKLKKILIVD